MDGRRGFKVVGQKDTVTRWRHQRPAAAAGSPAINGPMEDAIPAHSAHHTTLSLSLSEAMGHISIHDLILSLVLVSCLWAAAMAEVQYVVINNALNKAGGQRFRQTVGANAANNILSSSSAFIRKTFAYGAKPAYPDKPVAKVTLYVDDATGGKPAITKGDASGRPDVFEIHLWESYVATYTEADVATEVKGVLYHEMTHVWQWNGRGAADGGLIEGIADYVRLTAGLVPPHWRRPGQGDRWNQGYEVTALFLQYCESLQAGFVAALNAKLATGWNVAYFQDLLGQPVDQLWKSYKQKYGM